MGCVSVLPIVEQFVDKRGYQIMNAVTVKSVDNEDVIRKHQKLIRHLATGFPSTDRDDMFQIGCVALLEAARSWAGEAELWTYARRAVLGAMIDAASKNAEWFRRSSQVTGTDPNRDECFDSHEANYEPNLDEIADLRTALPFLNEDELEIVHRHVIDGQSFRAIGHATGRSIGDVFRTYEGATMILREKLT